MNLTTGRASGIIGPCPVDSPSGFNPLKEDIMVCFIGSGPDRIVGREFCLRGPFSKVFCYLVERLLHAELDDRRLATLVGPSDSAYLSEEECQLLAERLEEWTESDSGEYLAWLVIGDRQIYFCDFILPKLMSEQVGDLRRFLQHCGGLVVVKSDDEGDDRDNDEEHRDGGDSPSGASLSLAVHEGDA